MQRRSKITLLFAVIFSLYTNPGFAAVNTKPVISYTIVLDTEVVDISLRVNLKGTSWEKNKEQSICFDYKHGAARTFWAKDPGYKDIKITREQPNRICVSPDTSSFLLGYKVPIHKYRGELYSDDVPPVNINLNNAVLLFGKNTFLLPSYNDPELPFDPYLYLTIRRNKLKRLVSSIQLKEDKAEVNSMEELLSLVIMAGDISVRNQKVEKKNYLISLSGSWKNSQAELIRSYKAIAQKQLSTWGFLPANFILACFIKTKDVKTGFGFQYGNTIIYILPEKLNIKDPDFLKLLAHEHFHIWNGAYYTPKHDKEQELEWFHEGLTNYYALTSIVSSGLLTEEEFLAYLSSLYLKYDSSYNPAEPKKNKLIRDTFVVMAIDAEIIRASSAKKNLDNFIKAIAKNSLEWKKGYDNELIKMEMLKTANWDISSFFGDYINNPSSKINMEQYWGPLGISHGSDLLLQKYKESKAYKKFIRI